jgi:copper resistance protein D
VNDTLTIGIRFALYADLMLLFGLPLFGLYALKADGRGILPFRAIFGSLAFAAILLSLLSIVAMTASMAGVSLGEVDRDSLLMMIAETPMGIAWVVRMAALTCGLIIAIGRRSLMLQTVFASLALASLAWSGHGAAGEGFGGWVQLVADIIHLLAAGAWFGALVALAILLFRQSGDLRLLHRALDGFSVTGTLLVALIIITGLANSWMLVGPAHIFSIATTPYGQLLLGKLGLFAVMLALAASNRFRLTPALNYAIETGKTTEATNGLRLSLVTETGTAIAILGLVAWLGTLEPTP